MTDVNKDFRERLLSFSVDTILFLKTIPYRKEYDVLRYQLSKSATSIGANYEESQTSTYKEFLQRIKIALREANETIYWIKIIEKLNIADNKITIKLKNEAIEISLILGSIAAKTEKRIIRNDEK
jgi:four helix bundle protein